MTLHPLKKTLLRQTIAELRLASETLKNDVANLNISISKETAGSEIHKVYLEELIEARRKWMLSLTAHHDAYMLLARAVCI